ncbi:MAG: matrixin family metalloprotease [Balneolaceae bacterium]
MNTKRLIQILNIALILGVVVLFWLYFTLDRERQRAAVLPAVCTEPLGYTIGSIDSRFPVSEADVDQAVRRASELWAKELGHPAFEPGREPSVRIDLVYDERQQLADGELRARERIRSEQLVLNQRQQEYERLTDRFEARSAAYEQLAAEAIRERNELNNWVEDVNRSGQVTPSVQQEFEQRRERADNIQQRVLREREELDRMAERINRLVDDLNRLTDYNNELVDGYNRDFAGSNRFTKATYQQENGQGVITVSMVLSRDELALLLAHEMGHAFGLPHVENPASVMFAQLGEQPLYPVMQLTPEDKTALRLLCRQD